jgi:hypothetical protein
MISPRWLLVATALAGCAAPNLGAGTGSPRKTAAHGTAAKNPERIWADCYARFKPSGDPKADLARLTRACGPIGGMRPLTPMRVAAQKERDPTDRYTFYVPVAGACYRVYAIGDRGIRDLDLLLHGPDGDELAGDLTHDAFPVLPPTGPLCFETPGLYMLEVSVFRGSGRYALQIWGTLALADESVKTSESHARR